ERIGEPREFIPELHSAAISPGGHWLLARVAGGLQLFDGATCQPVGGVLANSSAVRAVYFSPHGQRAIGVDSNEVVRFWGTASRPSLEPSIQVPARVKKISFSPGKEELAVAFGDPADVALWNVVTGARAISLPRPGGTLYDCRFSPDGRWLATASWDGEARIFETAGGLPVGDGLHHRRGVARTVFSPDSRWLATASWDGTARVWSPGTGRPVSPSLHHAGYVASVAFSADSARLVTAGQDQTVRVWNLRTNGPARLELRHQGAVVQ